MNWREQARCRDLPLDISDRIFFDNGRPDAAQRICANCPVIDDCREFAETHLIPYGVYGGEQGGQRRARLGINLTGEVIGSAA